MASAETSNIKASAIRQSLRAEFGPRMYRINSRGEIFVLAKHEWTFYGCVNDENTLRKLGIDA